MNADTLLKEKRQEILRIASKYGAHNVRVFGSVARGGADQESDFDLLVRFDRGVTLLQQAALARELEKLLDNKVDVVSDKGLRPRIRERVLAEARPL
jgi:uncharacterized protein